MGKQRSEGRAFALLTYIQSINSRQQTPCLVSAYLSAQCTTDNSECSAEFVREGHLTDRVVAWGVPEIGPENSVGSVCPIKLGFS